MPIIQVNTDFVSNHLSHQTDFCMNLKLAAASIKELQLSPTQVSVICNSPFLCDRHEILVFVDGLFDKPERTPEVRQRLAEVIRLEIEKVFPNKYVEVFIRPFDPTWGFSATPRSD